MTICFYAFACLVCEMNYYVYSCIVAGWLVYQRLWLYGWWLVGSSCPHIILMISTNSISEHIKLLTDRLSVKLQKSVDEILARLNLSHLVSALGFWGFRNDLILLALDSGPRRRWSSAYISQTTKQVDDVKHNIQSTNVGQIDHRKAPPASYQSHPKSNGHRNTTELSPICQRGANGYPPMYMVVMNWTVMSGCVRKKSDLSSREWNFVWFPDSACCPSQWRCVLSHARLDRIHISPRQK